MTLGWMTTAAAPGSGHLSVVAGLPSTCGKGAWQGSERGKPGCMPEVQAATCGCPWWPIHNRHVTASSIFVCILHARNVLPAWRQTLTVYVIAAVSVAEVHRPSRVTTSPEYWHVGATGHCRVTSPRAGHVAARTQRRKGGEWGQRASS